MFDWELFEFNNFFFVGLNCWLLYSYLTIIEIFFWFTEHTMFCLAGTYFRRFILRFKGCVNTFLLNFLLWWTPVWVITFLKFPCFKDLSMSFPEYAQWSLVPLFLLFIGLFVDLFRYLFNAALKLYVSVWFSNHVLFCDHGLWLHNSFSRLSICSSFFELHLCDLVHTTNLLVLFVDIVEL